MSKKIPEPTRPPRQKAFLVGIEIKNQPGLLSIDDSLAELSLLADTAGLDVVGETYQKLDAPHAETLVGAGKVEEIIALVEETLADVIIFDNELSPRHQRELEKRFGQAIMLIDRTALILDIFAQHAHTREGSLQVQLAQYEYRLPRLTRAWTHLARQAGGASGRSGSVGGVGLRGPGETQLEIDRREISRMISRLKTELEKVRAHRQLYRAQRIRSRIPVAALVGYTNAGKSTLLNKLTRADVLVADQLFATLDPTTRRIELPGGNQALLTDTVGFIQKLPTQLIAAFQATLEEIAEADLLIHVVDISHPNVMVQWRSVNSTLREINADRIPVITVMNKIDRLPDPKLAETNMEQMGKTAAVSAIDGTGISELLKKIEFELYESFVPVAVQLPYAEGQLISIFHDQGRVDRIEHGVKGVGIQGNIPARLYSRFEPFLHKNHTPSAFDSREDLED
ncbi:MAG: GTPase HflX [Anaerolineaceae bacterium]